MPRAAILAAILAAAAIVLCPTTSRAEMLLFQFEGILTAVYEDPQWLGDHHVSGPRDALGDVEAGDPFSGFFWYDTTTPNQSNTPGYGNFLATNIIGLSIGDMQHSRVSDWTNIGLTNNTNTGFWDIEGDRFSFVGEYFDDDLDQPHETIGPWILGFDFTLIDPTGQMLIDTQIPHALDLNLATINSFASWGHHISEDGDHVRFMAFGYLTDIRIIPEPTTAALLLIAAACCVGRRR